ncbi:uncharacterized protein [Epargyreus clarus]|uniref:uncharacterized protein n=1 Tax=Epargyreus clarus TaxID=520877 RepID=UPI003C2E496B
MVRVSFVLSRVPAIKFRKGGLGSGGAAPASAPAASPAAAKPQVQAQHASPMSSAAISDIDLPARYRRQPLSQEEIDHINGGGVKDPKSPSQIPRPSVLKVPNRFVIQYGKQKKQLLSLRITLQKLEVPK